MKSRDAENAWKGKLREQVLRRVKENRREILSAARNRRVALMETILSAEMTRSSVKRGDPPVSSPFNIEKGDEDEDLEVLRIIKKEGSMLPLMKLSLLFEDIKLLLNDF